MDQIKVGAFIAEQRRKKKLTQAQLAEMLNITDRAVSKWENGKSLPDVGIMRELCDILGITVDDLLCGEVVDMENKNEKLEQALLEMIKEKEKNDKRLLTLEWVIGGLSILILLVPIMIAGLLPAGAVEDWVRVVLIFVGFVPCFIGFFFAIKIEQIAGYYQCRACGHKYVPSYKSVNLAPHMGRTRYMRCPECQKKTWQKKVISKD